MATHTKPPIPLDSLMLTRERLTPFKKKKKSKPELLVLGNLSLYLDWRMRPPPSQTLHKIASVIWQYLPRASMEEYFINFSESKEYKVIESQGLSTSSPPVLASSSPKGDLLLVMSCTKKTEEMEFEDHVFIIILFPSYISHSKYADGSIQLNDGTYCTFWEIENMERLTHVVMDRHGVIYFTDGEALYKIAKTEGDLYLDLYETIYTPQDDATRITALWRQSNDIYFSLQSYENEENIDVWKLRPVRNRGISEVSGLSDTPTSPGTPRSKRSYSGGGFTSGSDSEQESNDNCKKVKRFSLQYEERIWQLGSFRFEKKCLLSIGAAVMAQRPSLLQMGFHSRIKILDLVSSKNVLWPSTLSDETPHSIFFHKDTKSYFCLLPVMDKKAKGKLHWMQFKLNNKNKKKVTWQRLIEIPQKNEDDDGKQQEWLHYDETRDVMIGYKRVDIDKNEYVFKYLPDMSKYLWIEAEEKGKSSLPTMHRAYHRVKKKLKLTNRHSSNKKNKKENQKGVDQFTLSKKKKTKNGEGAKKSKKKIDRHSNIKPSLAKKKQDVNVVDEDQVMD